MNLIYDLPVILVVLFFAVAAARKGFAHTLVRLMGMFASVALASIISRPAASQLYNGFLRQPVFNSIAKSLQNSASPELWAQGIVKAVSSLPAFLTASIHLDVTQLSVWLQNTTNIQLDAVTTTITDSVIGPTMISLLQVILFLMIFALAMLFVRLLAGAFTGINKIPVVGQLNGLLGGILGGLQGILILYVGCAFVRLVILLTGNSIPFLSQENINSTMLLKYFFAGNNQIQNVMQTAFESLIKP